MPRSPGLSKDRAFGAPNDATRAAQRQITTLADGCKSELANVMRIRNLTNSNLFGPAAPPPPPAVVSQYAARLDRLRPGKACCKAACQFTAALCGCTKGRPVESDRGGLAQFYTEYTLSCAQKCTFNSIHDGTGSCPAGIDPVAAQKNCPA
ncbi:hypothetical protein QJQ45_024471 [Haematococcus lacustris]|nr:hypothetical protein QJQ45_024471 [Haematococcus lacustris]